MSKDSNLAIESLTTQSKVYSCTIGADYVSDIYFDLVQILANEWGFKYCTILHDKDSDYKHYHLFIELPKRIRMSTMLKRLANGLDCDLVNISIRVPGSVVGAIQYLVHKNDIFKYQYSSTDLVSNYDLKFLLDILESEFYSSELTTQQLIEIIYSTNNVLEIISKIGIGKYQHYRNTINDILEFKKKQEMVD